MKWTVAICTWNRATLLDRTLESMASLRIPTGVSWELLVSNNNCTDDTDAVLARHSGRLPLRRLFVEKPGKSCAANRIVDEATGEWILWTDDDVRVDPRWLEAYTTAVRQNPEVDILGGTVLPDYEREPPHWIRRNLRSFAVVFAICQRGPESQEWSQKTPLGVNMAVRRAVHRRYPFDTRLGPRPGSQIRGEEGRLIKAAQEAGHRLDWVADAIVYHFVPASRMTYPYMRDWWRGVGAEWALLAEREAAHSRFLGIPGWLWKAQLSASMKAAFIRLGGRSPCWLHHAIKAQIFRGMAQQYRTMSGRL